MDNTFIDRDNFYQNKIDRLTNMIHTIMRSADMVTKRGIDCDGFNRENDFNRLAIEFIK